MFRAGVESLELQAKLFRGFADASRLAILEALREGPLTVSQIVERTGLSQSNASNHLACLRDCALVTSVQEGRYVRYSLGGPEVRKLLDTAQALLGRVGDEIHACTRYAAPRRVTRGD